MGSKKTKKKDHKIMVKHLDSSEKLKSKCCDKYKKSEKKRCKKCPCFDLIKKTA
jgi:hypothetical protein